ncbi:MAG: transcription elongation factor GreA [Actinomycetota bacterium]|nr:transcription elongation factor GreA [Actinomycetota bacterium]
MSDTTKMTAQAYEQLQTDIEALEGEKRRELAERIGIAREWGDLKENAEYHAAKEDAAMLEAKIARMRDQLRTAEILEAADGQTAGMGSTVTYTDDGTGNEVRYKLVPAREASPSDGLLSIDSPVGRALAGAKVGAKCTLEAPSGRRTMTVKSIEQA